jgi:hypothetical protein
VENFHDNRIADILKENIIMTEKVKQHLSNEFQRGPVQFLMNAIQIVVLVGGLVALGIQIGAFKEQVAALEKNFDSFCTFTKTSFAAEAAEHCTMEERRRLEDKRIENAIVDHTGRPVR